MTFNAPADNCSDCLPGGRQADLAVRPHRVTPAGSGGIRADYRCPAGHSWWTGWDRAAIGVPAYDNLAAIGDLLPGVLAGMRQQAA